MKLQTVPMMALVAGVAAADPAVLPRQTDEPTPTGFPPGIGSPSPGGLIPDLPNSSDFPDFPDFPGLDGPEGKCAASGFRLLGSAPPPPMKLMSWYMSVAMSATTDESETASMTMSTGTETTATTTEGRGFGGPMMPPPPGGPGMMMPFPTEFCPPEITEMEADVATAYSNYAEKMRSWFSDNEDEISSALEGCPSEATVMLKDVAECTATPTVLASSNDDDEDDDDSGTVNATPRPTGTSGPASGTKDEGGAAGLNAIFAAGLASAAAFAAFAIVY